MRTILAVMFGLLSVLSVCLDAVCLFYLPSSLREWRNEPKDIAIILLGTLTITLLCCVFIRATLLGLGKSVFRNSLDNICTGFLVLLVVAFPVLSFIGTTKVWPPMFLGFSFLFVAWAFRYVSKRPVPSA